MHLLLKYNKVIDEAIDKIHVKLNNSSVDDLKIFGSSIDKLTYKEIDSFLSSHKNITSITIGDIFWSTGQNICHWGLENNVKIFFLQHGQWIYTLNKKNPPYLPYCTFVFGNNIKKELLSWPYGQKSKVEVTGNPRYDELSTSNDGFIYFAPPIFLELNPSAADIYHYKNIELIEALAGIDKRHYIKIHPHYREGKIEYLKKIFPYAEFIDKDEPALNYISKCDKVLTHKNSTTVLDGIACKKVVVLTNFTGYKNSFYKNHYFRSFAYECLSPSHCERTLKTDIRFSDDDPSDFILPGNATNNIINIIENK